MLPLARVPSNLYVTSKEAGSGCVRGGAMFCGVRSFVVWLM